MEDAFHGEALLHFFFIIKITPSMSEQVLQGCLAHKETPSPLGPPLGPRHKPLVGSYGGGVLMSEVPL